MNETKLYSQKAIGIATFLGGPLAAGFLIRRNFINLNKERAGLTALLLGFVSTFALLAAIFMVPENVIDSVPNSLIPAIYTGIIYLIVEKIQGTDLKAHAEQEREFYSGWRAAGIGTIGLVLFGALAFLLADLLTANGFDAEKYDNGIAQFSSNEDIALEIYSNTLTKNDEQLKSELLRGLELWATNKEILHSLDAIENLTENFIRQNQLLREYCDLRIEQYNLILKSVEEDTNSYDDQIQELGLKIELKISEIG